MISPSDPYKLVNQVALMRCPVSKKTAHYIINDSNKREIICCSAVDVLA